MCKHMTILLGFYLMKPIHVQLPDKGSEITMLEMFRKYLCRQSVYIFYYKPLTILSPRYYLIVLRILH